MLLHKIEVYVFDHEHAGAQSAVDRIASINERVPVHYVPKVAQTVEVKDWTDDHELNRRGTPIERFRDLFT